MPDKELLRIIEEEYDDYRVEALRLVEAELGKRGIPFEVPVLAADDNEDNDALVAAENLAPCASCGGAMRSGLLFADRELSILFADNNEERFVHAFACTSCGHVRLVADLETEVEN